MKPRSTRSSLRRPRNSKRSDNADSTVGLSPLRIPVLPRPLQPGYAVELSATQEIASPPKRRFPHHHRSGPEATSCTFRSGLTPGVWEFRAADAFQFVEYRVIGGSPGCELKMSCYNGRDWTGVQPLSTGSPGSSLATGFRSTGGIRLPICCREHF